MYRHVRINLIVGLVAVLTLLLGLSPAAAQADRFSFRGDIAVGAWSLDDPRDTHVFLAGIDGTRHDSSGPPEDVREGFINVFQSFCDTDADEQVFRSFFAFTEDVEVAFEGRLQSASLEGEQVAVSGVEVRTPDCDDPDFENHRFIDLGDTAVDISAHWDGEGRLDTNVSTFHFSHPPDFGIHSTHVSQHRDATATGTLSGLEAFEVPAQLGEADFADLMRVTDSTVFVD